MAGTDALDGLKKLYETRPDLIIMTRELPMIGGEDPCLRIRQASYLPMIVLGSEEYAAETLELGADAYMANPPSSTELVARVRALLRRTQGHDPPGGNPRLYRETSLPKKENGLSGLTRTEFRLASCLILNKGRLLGYLQLVSEVWGEGSRPCYPPFPHTATAPQVSRYQHIWGDGGWLLRLVRSQPGAPMSI